MENKIILISNDDGIHSVGLKAIVNEVLDLGDVYIAAPDRQRSASSQALTVDNPLMAVPYLYEGIVKAWSINGTPADCVKLAVNALLPRKPDLIISGINLGQNTSVNVLYSGTVGAAYEGAIAGIPSIALSLADFSPKADCSAAAKFGKLIANTVLSESDYPDNHILNVNIPKAKYEDIKGILFTDCSNSKWIDKYDKRTDPFGREYYWFAGNYVIDDERLESDDKAIANNFVSVTPIKFELTNKSVISEFKNKFKFSVLK